MASGRTGLVFRSTPYVDPRLAKVNERPVVEQPNPKSIRPKAAQDTGSNAGQSLIDPYASGDVCVVRKGGG